MNIVYSSDENYVQHMAVSMLSLFKHNAVAAELNVFIISNGISQDSQRKLERLAEEYGRAIQWIDFGPFRDQLVLDMEWPISVSSYARLFLAQMLPDWCERVLYLDCDTVICDNLEELWDTDMSGCAVAGVKDLVVGEFKGRIGLGPEDIYINAGVLLVNLKYWREQGIQASFIKFIDAHQGRVTHHDQGVINGTLQKQICMLSPKYNAMTPFFTNHYKRLIRFFGLTDYYGRALVEEAVRRPAIIHYTPEYVGRVWEHECRHPKAELYRRHLDDTVWAGNLVHAKPLPFKMKLLYWMNQNLPVAILKVVLKNR